MREPLALSKTYRESGRPHAVFAYGLVLFLTPSEYATVQKKQADALWIQDATEEQIAAHDRWYGESRDQADREAELFRRLFGGQG